MITSILSIKNIFINNKCCSSCFRSVTTENESNLDVMHFWKHTDWKLQLQSNIGSKLPSNSHSYLPYCSIFPKYIVHFLSSNLVWKVTNIQYSVDFWWKSHLKAKTHIHHIEFGTATQYPKNKENRAEKMLLLNL